jgi:hypothetical protein
LDIKLVSVPRLLILLVLLLILFAATTRLDMLAPVDTRDAPPCIAYNDTCDLAHASNFHCGRVLCSCAVMFMVPCRWYYL